MFITFCNFYTADTHLGLIFPLFVLFTDLANHSHKLKQQPRHFFCLFTMLFSKWHCDFTQSRLVHFLQ